MADLIDGDQTITDAQVQLIRAIVRGDATVLVDGPVQPGLTSLKRNSDQ